MDTFAKIPLLAGLATVAASAPTFAHAQNYDVTLYSQQQKTWAKEKLGFSGVYTIGSDGCVITSLAMLLSSLGVSYNPSTMNAALKASNAYSGALVIWNKLPRFQGRIDYSSTSADLTKIRSLLNSGYRVMVETRMGASHQYTHYVALYGIGSNGDPMVADPWTGDKVGFTSRFGDPKRWIYSVEYFR